MKKLVSGSGPMLFNILNIILDLAFFLSILRACQPKLAEATEYVSHCSCSYDSSTSVLQNVNNVVSCGYLIQRTRVRDFGSNKILSRIQNKISSIKSNYYQ